jgi:peptidoglycan/LPS O-acetylase OafA/YrhL
VNSYTNPGYRNNNFNILRLIAAVLVIVSHSYGLLGKGKEQPALWYNDKHLILSDVGLFIFFTISGFLVTQSVINTDSLKEYAWKRVLRIMPALIVVNLACILMGCFVTTLPFNEYFFNAETWIYFLKNSTFLANQFTLPGVFTTLTDNSVNASLWTLLIEVQCYIVLLMGATHIVTRKWLFLACFIIFEATRIYARVINKIEVASLDLEADFTYGTYFFLGSLYYCFKELVPLKWLYVNVLLALALVTVPTIVQPVTEALFFAYFILIIGTSKAVVDLKGYDMSYGLYLYAFPVQQLVLYFVGYQINVGFHIGVSTVISLAFAFLSWVFIEKPFLNRKRSFVIR